ncbi:integrase arm-type DNA-binding domain-containing protein [Rhodoferax ferrireducens]|uniref:tyrosine-type recombinase/integrase n=1 Tax=Rhodoferax ferrireducens TaxID=192843 RepID=UPI00298E2B91|nr:integrase arm-type DNA-binding domain-containing protein [Rhodoferax ferrireducens]WPC65264.1 integrase arm-type DNA-binding domain-containing protein [Rhodoferax ferrireducens]
MLTEIACKAATCPTDKTRARFTDAGGLYLEVSPNESKRWFWKYRFGGKEKRLSLGSYPAVKLKDVRIDRDDARKLLTQGTDPTQKRQLDKAATRVSASVTYEKVARELHGMKLKEWSDVHGKKWLRLQELNLFPWFGSLPLADITAPLLLETLRRVETRGKNETAHALRLYAGQVFRYGMATGRCLNDPAHALRGALQAVIVKNMGAVLEPKQAGELLRAIDAYHGHPTTREALVLSSMLFQRPGNIRQMEWTWIDFDAAMLTIPAASMKRTKQGKINGRPHLVPLAPQAIACLKRMQTLSGHGRYVFPSLLTGERPMSDNTVNTALRRMGYTNTEMTAHGFRAMARTILGEQLETDGEVIEAQLAHGKSGPLGSAYDRTTYMVQRRKMMSEWADYLDKLRVGADVIQLRA